MRQKVTTQAKTKINTWQDADAVLADIAKRSEVIKKEEGAYNEKEQAAREKLTEKHAPFKVAIGEHERGLEAFCNEKRSDFGDAKTKKLSHGSVSFRISPQKVKQLKGWTQATTLKALEAVKAWKNFVRVKKTIDKDVILIAHAKGTVDNGKLAKIGVEVTQDETFGYDLKLAAGI